MKINKRGQDILNFNFLTTVFHHYDFHTYKSKIKKKIYIICKSYHGMFLLVLRFLYIFLCPSVQGICSEALIYMVQLLNTAAFLRLLSS